jgi:N-acetylneuraminate synthase
MVLAPARALPLGEGLMARRSVRIAGRDVGPGRPCFIVAEIGINHNGDLAVAKRLIDVAVAAGCDAVKFQKRTIEVVYTQEELDRPRESPFGETNRDLKLALEFGRAEYQEIDRYCRERGIPWFASCWDEASVDFVESFDPPCFKISSALLTHGELLRHLRSLGRPILMSTGMSTMDEIRHAVEVLGVEDLILMHCTSTYPSPPEELNLRVITTLQREFPCPVGYSGHEVGLQTSVAAVALGACAVERHITLDRAMWGSDQAASVEPQGVMRLVRDIRVIEKAMGDGRKRVYDSELPVRAKLRRDWK